MNFSDQILADSLDGKTNCNGSPNITEYFEANITINQKLSTSAKEYIAVTIMHEILHGYMTFTGRLGEFNQHTDMANTYITGMKDDLIQMFPNMLADEAEALAWGGLGETKAWKDLVSNNPIKANNIVIINQAYKLTNGSKGQRCH